MHCCWFSLLSVQESSVHTQHKTLHGVFRGGDLDSNWKSKFSTRSFNLFFWGEGRFLDSNPSPPHYLLLASPALHSEVNAKFSARNFSCYFRALHHRVPVETNEGSPYCAGLKCSWLHAHSTTCKLTNLIRKGTIWSGGILCPIQWGWRGYHVHLIWTRYKISWIENGEGGLKP